MSHPRVPSVAMVPGPDVRSHGFSAFFMWEIYGNLWKITRSMTVDEYFFGTFIDHKAPSHGKSTHGDILECHITPQESQEEKEGRGFGASSRQHESSESRDARATDHPWESHIMYTLYICIDFWPEDQAIFSPIFTACSTLLGIFTGDDRKCNLSDSCNQIFEILWA